MFTTDYYVSGIAPFGKQIVVLSYDEEESEEEVSEPLGKRYTGSGKRTLSFFSAEMGVRACEQICNVLRIFSSVWL